MQRKTVEGSRRLGRSKRNSDNEQLGAKGEIVKGLFEKAETPAEYRRALYFARQLKGTQQLLILDALFAAADRLEVDKQSGMPRVKPFGCIRVRGRRGAMRDVVVEILA